jgi:hypothetical protein
MLYTGYVKQFDNRQIGGPATGWGGGADVNNYQADQFIILPKPATKQQHM